MAMMDALVKRDRQEGLWLEQVEKPSPGRGEVLVKIHKTAICETDMHIYEWNDRAKRMVKTPVIIGREFAGRIEEVGEDAGHFAPGDLVSGEGRVVCGRCRNCLAGRRHLCKDTQEIGVDRTGVFAQYAVIPAENVWLCKGDISEDLVSIFDPLGNAARTALSFDMVGEDVLITSAGYMGIMAVAIAKYVGAKSIVITDVNDYRLELAAKMGASRTVNMSRESIADIEEEIGMKDGFDVGLEMSGSKQAFAGMVDNMAHGGKIAVFGSLPPDTVINWDKVILNGLWIKGIYDKEMFETWYKMNSMLQSGLDIAAIITHEFDYQNFKEGFEAMRSGKSGKVVLNWA